MSDREFKFQDVIDEIDALQKIVRPFCQPASREVLPRLITSLNGIRETDSNRDWQWGMPQEQPFYTEVSRGEYQPNDEGELNVYAEISSTWTLEESSSKAISARRDILLAGNASTRVRLHREPSAAAVEWIGQWRPEVADSVSPGCHFHVQIAGDSDEFHFQSLSMCDASRANS